MGVAMFTGALLCCNLSAHAEDEELCLVVSGSSQPIWSFSLFTNKRIYFGKDRMTIKSEDMEEQELLYSVYNHLEFYDAEPTRIDDVQKADDTLAHIELDLDNKSLTIESMPEMSFVVGVFGLNGRKYLTARIAQGESLSFHSLPPGTYIVAAVSGKTKISRKFIFK